jgi:hypothetical protein
MSDLFLSPAELAELTGYRDRHAQARWLDRHHWRYVRDRHNQPRVARNHFNERMGCGGARGAVSYAAAINEAAADVQPNFAALARR